MPFKQIKQTIYTPNPILPSPEKTEMFTTYS